MSRGYVLSLCDRTGQMVQPWLSAGYQAMTIDLQDCPEDHHPSRHHHVRDVCDPWCKSLNFRDCAAIFAFPPCTHVAVSGSKHFKTKGLPKLIEALEILNACREICEASGAPYMIENPVSVFSSYWRKPDYYFNPYDYTAFELGDHYTKKTCLWTGNGFVMPPPNPDASLADVKPDDRIHKAPPSADRGDLRSVTPMGFARAVFYANAPHLKQKAAE